MAHAKQKHRLVLLCIMTTQHNPFWNAPEISWTRIHTPEMNGEIRKMVAVCEWIKEKNLGDYQMSLTSVMFKNPADATYFKLGFRFNEY